MNTRLIIHPVMCCLAALMLQACGDLNVSSSFGTPGSWVPPLDEDPEPAYALGQITALGSVTVHGVRYSTSSATVTLNGDPGSLSDLKTGHIVAVTGEINRDGFTGTAHQLTQEGTVIGPVEAFDPASARLIVLGQVVVLNEETRFGPGIDPGTYDGLATDVVVQVSGFPDGDGQITATRIETYGTGLSQQVVGSVRNHEAANERFNLGTLIVDYSDATSIELPTNALVDGEIVTVKGTVADGVFAATRITQALIAVSPEVAGDRAQLEGLVTRTYADGSFALNDIEVVTNAATRFMGGSRNEIIAGTRISVSGHVASPGGAIRADVISFTGLQGTTVTIDFADTDFTRLDISSLMNVTVIRSNDFSIRVTVDDDVADNVIVTREDATLHLGLQVADNNVDTLDAVITMPWLDRVQMSGIARARLVDFDQSEMSVTLAGLNRLLGVDLMLSHLDAVISSLSVLDFSDTRPLTSASVQITGTSQATLNMDSGATIEGSVGTRSTLFYYGTDVTNNVVTSRSGSVRRLGDTRY